MEYKSLASFEITGRGTVFIVKNDKDREGFGDLIGKEAVIDKVKYIIKGVELRMHSRTHREGEQIGLLVKPLNLK